VKSDLLEVRAVSKHFGGVHAVVDASVTLAADSVHGLVGENGAGKSTLAKIISGVYAPDQGEVLVGDSAVSFHSPRDALSHGIATIAQEIALVPRATVAENVLLGIEPNAAGILRGRDLRRRFEELNERTGFRLSANTRVGSLRTARAAEGRDPASDRARRAADRDG